MIQKFTALNTTEFEHLLSCETGDHIATELQKIEWQDYVKTNRLVSFMHIWALSAQQTFVRTPANAR